MKKLYDVVFTNDVDKRPLYYKDEGEIQLLSDGIAIKAGSSIDFLTYFNSFSLCKWKEYTTLQGIELLFDVCGKANLEIYSIGNGGGSIDKCEVDGKISRHFSLSELTGDILGVRIRANTDCVLKLIRYQGEFEEWNDLKIGVSICTFKRERYVRNTINKLVGFSESHPWLTTLVVDNGSTLEECEEESLRILHNPNYGGSGGFTRGLLENLKSNDNDYVLLMDDDIDLETSSLEHMYGLLCGLKEEYRESFLSGAMLRMDTPCIQHENTAYWWIKVNSLGKGRNLTLHQALIDNENIANYTNQYAAWWFCCIPLNRVRDIGLPLPVFIKGDDIEYSIRNGRKIIMMNGIGVWHEPFETKNDLWVEYFAFRSTFIINQYAKGCNRWTLLAMITGRIGSHIVRRDFKKTKVLNRAIFDAMLGFEVITSVPADIKLQEVRKMNGDGSYIDAVIGVLCNMFKCLRHYDSINRNYRDFRDKMLMDDKFWWEYLERGKHV